MKKITYSIVLYFLISTWAIEASARSIVPLSASGSVAPSSAFNISLNGLVASATYSVVCYVDTTYPFQYILLSSNFSSTTSIVISYSLNGNYVTQDQLLVGQNLVVINGTFTNPTTDSLVFTNLDPNHAFNVTNCFAIPIQVTGF